MNSALRNTYSSFADMDAIWSAGSHEEAETKARALLKSDSADFGAMIILGRALTLRKQFDQAEGLFKGAASQHFWFAEATLGLFECFLLAGRYVDAKVEALELIERCTEVRFLAAYFRLPTKEQSTSANEALHNRLLYLITETPKSAELHLLLARFYLLIGNKDKAANSYLHAVGCPDGGERLLNGYGTFLYELGKLKQSARVFSELVRLQPREPYHHIVLSGIYFKLGSLEEAERALLVALDLEPGNVVARINLGSIQSQMRRYSEAVRNIDIAMAGKDIDDIKSDSFWLKQALQLIYFKRHLSDWSESPRELISILEGASDEDLSVIAFPPFHLMTMQDSPELQRRVASMHNLPLHQSVQPAEHAPLVNRKLRIGWFGSDFHDHATMYLLMGVFREYDRETFEFSVYSYGYPRQEAYRFKTAAAVDHFYELGGADDQEIIDLAKSHELDIAIDLKGYTAGGKSNIFAARLAPIQIFYLGYPGTSGKDYFDYLIADDTIITPALRAHYSESILYLPHSYQPNDPQREFVKSNLTRGDYGLPEEAIIFCSFNQSYKISADEFEVWLELLRRVSNSVLWLLSSGDSDAVIRTKLRDRGFDENRVIFGEPLSVDKHLARLSAADIFLDSFVVNGHTSVSDALFAGLPVVTLPGSQFAARVGASLLKAAGCDYLIARDRQDYLTKALTLATEPNYLRTVKKHLNENLMRSPLYDVQTYTRSLQKLFSKAVANSFKGEQPMDISLKEAEEK